MNDFWNMQRDYQPLNDTVNELELRLTYQPLSLFRWQIYAAQTSKNKWTNPFSGTLDITVICYETYKYIILMNFFTQEIRQMIMTAIKIL